MNTTEFFLVPPFPSLVVFLSLSLLSPRTTGLAGPNTSEEALFKLKTAELKHGRLAMIGMLGIASQAAKNGEGALEALSDALGQ